MTGGGRGGGGGGGRVAAVRGMRRGEGKQEVAEIRHGKHPRNLGFGIDEGGRIEARERRGLNLGVHSLPGFFYYRLRLLFVRGRERERGCEKNEGRGGKNGGRRGREIIRRASI